MKYFLKRIIFVIMLKFVASLNFDFMFKRIFLKLGRILYKKLLNLKDKYKLDRLFFLIKSTLMSKIIIFDRLFKKFINIYSDT
jgi:hypothetical protein